MTIDKSKTINIPVWLVSVIVPIVITLLTSFGVLTSAKATLETRAKRNEQDIETLRKEKIQRDEFTLVIQKLNSIETKLDAHIQNNK